MNGTSDRLDATAQRAFVAEKLNGAITAVVMESRGIYAAPDIAAAKPFAAGLRKQLDNVDQLAAQLKRLSGNTDAQAVDAVLSDLAKFREFRVETARLGESVSPQAANVQGNNDANRANRRALQASVDRLTDQIRNELEPLRARIDGLQNQTWWRLVILTGVGLLIGGSIAIWIGTQTMSRPLRRASETLRRLASGELDVAVEAQRSKDEIGDLWQSTKQLLEELRQADRLRIEQRELAVRAESDKRAAMHSLADESTARVSGVVRTVAEAVSTLERNAATMSASADQTSRQSNRRRRGGGGSYKQRSDGSLRCGRTGCLRPRDRTRCPPPRRSRKRPPGKQPRRQTWRAGFPPARRGSDRWCSSSPTSLRRPTSCAERDHRGGPCRRCRKGVRGGGERSEVARRADLEGDRRNLGSGFRRAGATDEVVRAIEGISDTIRKIDDISSAIANAIDQQGAATGEIAQNVSQAAQGTQEVSSSITGVSAAAQATGRVSTDIVHAANRSLGAGKPPAQPGRHFRRTGPRGLAAPCLTLTERGECPKGLRALRRTTFFHSCVARAVPCGTASVQTGNGPGLVPAPPGNTGALECQPAGVTDG